MYTQNSENERRCPYLEQYHYYEIVKDAYIIEKEPRFTSELGTQ